MFQIHTWALVDDFQKTTPNHIECYHYNHNQALVDIV